MSYETIRIERDPRGVAHLWLARAEKHNAMNAVMIDELTAAAADLGAILRSARSYWARREDLLCRGRPGLDAGPDARRQCHPPGGGAQAGGHAGRAGRAAETTDRAGAGQLLRRRGRAGGGLRRGDRRRCGEDGPDGDPAGADPGHYRPLCAGSAPARLAPGASSSRATASTRPWHSRWTFWPGWSRRRNWTRPSRPNWPRSWRPRRRPSLGPSGWPDAWAAPLRSRGGAFGGGTGCLLGRQRGAGGHRRLLCQDHAALAGLSGLCCGSGRAEGDQGPTRRRCCRPRHGLPASFSIRCSADSVTTPRLGAQVMMLRTGHFPRSAARRRGARGKTK